MNKQNKYPAMLLTQGINTKYKDYQDPRTWTIPLAVSFVKMAGLLGKMSLHWKFFFLFFGRAEPSFALLLNLPKDPGTLA